jgi:DNA-binding GntR family transcriptional regulator
MFPSRKRHILECNADRADGLLRPHIIFGQFAPGEVLSEEVLMMPFHVGCTPIRDAMARLGHAGLIKEFPRKGTHVPSIDFTDPRGDLRGGRATRGTGRPSRRGPRPRHDARSQP